MESKRRTNSGAVNRFPILAFSRTWGSTIALTVAVLGNHPALAVTFDWAVIGNPGNAPDSETGYGGVDYNYRISKHEVTNAQYVDFLNAVGTTDTFGLYHENMELKTWGGIVRSGSPGAYTYSVKPDATGQGPGGVDGEDYTYANKPVVYVSFFDVMRFVNWLENGQPTGLQGPATTEDGVYSISNGISEVRSPKTKFFLPNENEWYKAAYHDGSAGTAAVYYNYATATNTKPNNNLPSADTGNSANYADAFTALPATGNIDYSMTDTGAYASSPSPYGTFDQAGNVWEWTETLAEPVPGYLARVLRGSSWENGHIDKSRRLQFEPTKNSLAFGFRVASMAPIPIWISATAGSWNDSANWQDGIVPNSAGARAIFGDAISSPTTVVVDMPVTVQSVHFGVASDDGDSQQYAVAGQAALTFDSVSGSASIDVIDGHHNFQAVVELAADTDVDIASGATLAFNNTLALNGHTLTKTGIGDLVIRNDLTVSGGAISLLDGTLSGNGSIGGAVANVGGTVAPGNSGGALTVHGDYSQASAGRLEVEIDGTSQGETYDFLDVHGSATLSGHLRVDLLNSFLPTAGDSFEIVGTMGAMTGQFESADFPDLPFGLEWRLTYKTSSVILTVIPDLTGDYNNDGAVDGRDFLAWQRGDSPDPLSSEDLALWQANYGAAGSLGGSAPIPEPCSCALLCGALVWIWISRFLHSWDDQSLQSNWVGLAIGADGVSSSTKQTGNICDYKTLT